MASSTPPVTISNFTGIDFNQIVQAETAAQQVQITGLNGQVSADNTEISALGQISGALTSLQNSLTSFNNDATTAPVSVSAAPNAPFTAYANGTPSPGTYTLAVSQLAAAQMSASQGYSSDSANVGTGTLTISVAGNAHTITVDSTNDTLSGLAGAINSAGIGVTAQVVNTGLPADPYRLEISANTTGAANSFSVGLSLDGGTVPNFSNSAIGPASMDSVSGTATPTFGGTYTGALSQGYHFKVVSGGTVGTDPLTISWTSDSGETGSINVPSGYVAGSPLSVADGLNLYLDSGTLNPGDSFSVATFNPTLSVAQNALVQVGNQVVSSSTNTVTNAIPGVSLNLTGTTASSTVTVSQNVSAEANDVATFVNSFNSVTSIISGLTQALPNQTAPPLANNGAMESVLFGLQEGLGAANLSKLGVSIDSKTGQLSFDSGQFASNVASDPAGVQTALTAIYNALNGTVSSALTPVTGGIAATTSSINNQITQLNQQITQLQNQYNQQQQQLTDEYALLQGLIAQYQSTESFLAAQDGSSSNSSGSSSSSSSPSLTVNG
jgi:flagellar hook-associated protein 2